MDKSKKQRLKQLQEIPGVGPSIAEDLWQLGYHSIEQLKDSDPEKMYENLCKLQNCRVDRCMLYVFRCAVYFASNDHHDPNLLKWWNWKDGNY